MPDEQPYKSRFLLLPVDAYDTGIDLVLPNGTLRLYEYIRRFVQRRKRSDNKKIYTDIRQNALAKRINHNRQWVNKAIGLLEELGWLKRALIPNDNTGQKRYVLGYLNDDNEEVFWADKRLEAYRRHVCKATETKMDDFNKVSWDDRVSLLAELLKPVLGPQKRPQKRPAKGRGVSSPQDRGVSSPQDRGCLAGETGGVFPARQGVSSPQDTLNIQVLNRQVSNRQVSKDAGEAFASPPASAKGSGIFWTTDIAPPPPAGTTDATEAATDPTPSSVAPLPFEPTAQDTETGEAEYRTWLDHYGGDEPEPEDDDDAEPEDDSEEAPMGNDAASRMSNLFLTTKKAEDKAAAEKAQQDLRRARRAKKNLEGGEQHVPKGTIAALEKLWRELFEEHYPDFRPARWWTVAGSGKDARPRPGKEAGLTSQLVQMYSVGDITKYFRWAVKEWGKLAGQYPKLNVPAVPAIGFMFAFRESLLPEALKISDRASVEAQLEDWYTAHPDEPPPPELKAKLNELAGKA